MATTEAEKQQLVEDAGAALDLGGLPVGWVVLVETIDHNDNRVFHRLYNDGISPWAYRGFLVSAMAEEEWD
jgi:hypothetical protein